MKKIFLLDLMLCIMASCFVYAGKVNIAGQVSPFSVQVVSASSGTFVSTYGFGAGGGFRVNVWDNLSVGMDLNLGIYKYDELDSDYMVIGVKALAGYSYDFTEKLFAEADLGVGLDNRRIGSHKQNSFAADLYLGCGYRLSDEFAVTGGVDLGLGLQKGKYSRSTDFEAEARLGLLMAL
ncbi:MAG: hypothetical protein ILP16_09025 [Spirochaetales bacterium]|nr:hypothetical protein [Spirochaetales bacterium]